MACIPAPALLPCPHVHPPHQDPGADRGQVYFSYRLVRSERSGERVRQRTLLNLGSDFGVTPEHWPVLCARIEQLISPQAVLVELGCAESSGTGSATDSHATGEPRTRG